jgi:transcriptional regulator with XRE-family HTH domain
MIIVRYVTMIAELLLDLRKCNAVPQERLAFAAGVDGAQVSKYERGLVIPSVETLLRLLKSMRHSVVVMPDLFAETAVQRNAVVTAAAKWYATGDLRPKSEHAAVDDGLALAVQQLVAAELRHRGGAHDRTPEPDTDPDRLLAIDAFMEAAHAVADENRDGDTPDSPAIRQLVRAADALKASRR